MTILRILAALALAQLLAACTAPPERLQAMADRNYMRYAMGKSYAHVATLNSSALMGGESGYGPPIGSYRLADGDTVHRHMGESGSIETGMNFAGLVGTNRVATNYRLAYFRVGPDGIVKDWAVGSVPGEQSSCIRYIGGIVEKCEDQSLVRRNFAVLDSMVTTSGGQPLGAWGAPAETAVPAEAPV